MAENTSFSKPTFTIEDDGGYAEFRLRSLEIDIHRRPEAYAALIKGLGSLLTDNTTTLDDQSSRPEALNDDPAHRLQQFFRLRFDRLIEFDEDTENAIIQNEEYQGLLKIHHASVNKEVKLGVQKKGSIPNANAEPIRDQLRRKRLELFIGRVADWENLQSTTHSRARGSKAKLKRVV